MEKRNYKVLIAGDPEEQYLLKEALKESNSSFLPVFLENGNDVLDYLDHKNKFSNNVEIHLPQLIMLDLNIPNKGGMEVLQEIKSHPKFHKIPVIIFSNSDNQEDITKTYNFQANSYVKKPSDLNSIIKVLGTLDKFWFEMVKLPKNPA